MDFKEQGRRLIVRSEKCRNLTEKEMQRLKTSNIVPELQYRLQNLANFLYNFKTPQDKVEIELPKHTNIFLKQLHKQYVNFEKRDLKPLRPADEITVLALIITRIQNQDWKPQSTFSVQLALQTAREKERRIADEKVKYITQQRAKTIQELQEENNRLQEEIRKRDAKEATLSKLTNPLTTQIQKNKTEKNRRKRDKKKQKDLKEKIKKLESQVSNPDTHAKQEFSQQQPIKTEEETYDNNPIDSKEKETSLQKERQKSSKKKTNKTMTLKEPKEDKDHILLDEEIKKVKEEKNKIEEEKNRKKEEANKKINEMPEKALFSLPFKSMSWDDDGKNFASSVIRCLGSPEFQFDLNLSQIKCCVAIYKENFNEKTISFIYYILEKDQLPFLERTLPNFYKTVAVCSAIDFFIRKKKKQTSILKSLYKIKNTVQEGNCLQFLALQNPDHDRRVELEWLEERECLKEKMPLIRKKIKRDWDLKDIHKLKESMTELINKAA